MNSNSDDMANAYGISDEVEKMIRSRDTHCVYCHKLMKQPSFTKGERSDWATIEHFDNDSPLDAEWNLGMCCWACNSSKSTMTMEQWFKTSYCIQKGINALTVAEPAKAYLRRAYIS